MSAIGTLVATAAFTVGAVAAARVLKRFRSQPKKRDEVDACDAPLVELEAEADTGVWRLSPDRQGRRSG